MTIAIVGSRGLTVSDFTPYLPEGQIEKIVSGGAKGIDSDAAAFARAGGIALEEIKPNYERYGRGAPIVRNKQIVDAADLTLIFWDGASKGTKSVIDYCRKQGRRYLLYIQNETGFHKEQEEGDQRKTAYP